MRTEPSLGARPMKNALPIAAVTLALAIVWYIAAVAMNASLQHDRFANAGQTDYSTADFVGATLNMDRPKLPAPHQIVAELWRSVVLTDPSSKRSLTFHAAITLRETLLGFAIGVARGRRCSRCSSSTQSCSTPR